MAVGPIRIAHVTEAYEGGVATFLRHLLPSLKRSGLNVTLICSPRDPDRYASDLERLRRSDVDVRVIRMSRGLHMLEDLAAPGRLWRVLRDGRFDIVHTHGFTAGVLGRLVAGLARSTKVVHSPHCFPFLRSRWQIARWAALLAERCMVPWTGCFWFVSSSERLAAEARGLLRRTPCTVIPNGIPPGPMNDGSQRELQRAALGIGVDTPVIGASSRQVREKGLGQLLDALSLLAARKRPVAALLIGDGPDRGRLVSRAQRLGLQQRVHFAGHRHDAADLLNAMDVFVQCSDAEGMPYAILEAMDHGLPVLASRVPGHTDLIQHGRTGWLYPPGSVPALAETIERCLADPQGRRRMGQAAKQHVRDHHDLQQQVHAALAFYENLAAQRPASLGPLVHIP